MTRGAQDKRQKNDDVEKKEGDWGASVEGAISRDEERETRT